MPATLLPNPFLERPSIVWCWDWYLESSFPRTFPFTFDVAPFRFSTVDLYPGGVLGDILYEARLLDRPELQLTSTDAFGGLQQVESVRFRLAASTILRWRVYIDTGGTGGFDPTGFDPAGFDTVGGVFTGIQVTPLGLYPDLHVWVTNEHRGKLLIGHLVELDPKTFRSVAIQPNAFVGETLALADDPGTVSVLGRALDLASMTETIPATLITTGWAPYAPAASLGRPVPLGVGIGRRIPCLPVKAKTEEPELFRQNFTAIAATDLLTITDHLLDTGAGPFRLSTTGTLPGGLFSTIEYWAVVFDDHQLRLALTLGKALTGVTVDISDAGTGVHTMTGGLAPNLSEDYDCVVGHGNIGIIRVWEDEAAQGSIGDELPDAPVTYQVQHRTYRPGGRYATSIRFQEQLDGVNISADMLRVYPDVDDLVIGEWKWLTGFQDDVGGYDAVSAPDAPETVTTSNLVPTHQRYGLGGVALDGSQWFRAPGTGPVTRLNDFTVEVECIPAVVSAGTSGGLVTAPGGGSPIPAWSAVPAWSVYYVEATQHVSVFVVFLDGSTWFASTIDGSVPRGRPARITLRRSGTTTELYLGHTLTLTDTRSAGLAYGTETDFPMTFGVAQGVGFRGTLGWVRISAGARSQRYLNAAYYLWRHNPIEFGRELVTDARRLVNGTSFDTAAAMIDGVEGGTLYADGWLLDENELRAVLDALVPFRDLQFSIGTDTRLAVDVAAAPTVIQGQFGHGDEYANLLELPVRTRASLTEAPRRIAVRFRRSRATVPGPFGGYAMEITRQVLGVGRDAAPLELPFVDHPVTADQIADFRSKRLRTRDAIIDVVLGHEGRNVSKGDIIRLNVPAMAIVAQDLEAVQLAKGPEKVALRGVPTNDADFLYTPQVLPPDPADRTLQVTDLGDVQSLQAILANTRLTLQLNLSDAKLLLPTNSAAGEYNAFHAPPFAAIVGASADYLAIDEPFPDDGASYIEATAAGQECFVYFSEVAAVSGIIDGVAVRARARSIGGAGVLTWQLFLDPLNTADDWAVPAGGDWTDLSASLPLRPRFPGTDTPWTLDEVNALVGRLSAATVPGGGWLDVTQFSIVAYLRRELPLQKGFVRYWIRGPSVGMPNIPVEADASQITAIDLTPQPVDLPNPALGLAGVSGDTFWCWAGVYDEFGRLITLIGPQSVTLP